MRPSNVELHGLDTPLDEELLLHAGSVSCIFEPARGYLRRVQLGEGHEILQLIYLHVRARDWSTVMPKVTIVEKMIGKDHFHIVWNAHSIADNVDFSWQGTATGSPDGTIVYRCDGHAVHNTVTNRTGVCALIPATYAGIASVVLTHPDGTKSVAKLPEHVSPVEPLHNYVAASYPGATLVIEGDLYNAEDQRNWTDNSFKAYPICGTRSLYTLQEGARVMNQITIKAEPETLKDLLLIDRRDSAQSGSLPEIGVRILGQERDIERVRGIVDFLHYQLPDDPTEAETGLKAAQTASAGQELGLVLEFRGIHRSEAIRNAATTATRIVGLDTHGGPMGEQDRNALGKSVITGAGAFQDLNFHGRLEGIPAGVYFGAMPQVHTFDETSILDNTRTLEESSRSARTLAKTGASHATLSLANQPDPRLNSRFGAVWLFMAYTALAKGLTQTVVASSLAELGHTGAGSHPWHLIQRLHELRKNGAQVQYQETDYLGDLVVLTTDQAMLAANRTRRDQPLDLLGKEFKGSLETLTVQGWKPREGSAPLGPYELVSAKKV